MVKIVYLIGETLQFLYFDLILQISITRRIVAYHFFKNTFCIHNLNIKRTVGHNKEENSFNNIWYNILQYE
jgi:hypothetical protein